MSNTAKELLEFQIRRQSTAQYKGFLNILEDLKSDNVISEEYFKRLRAKVLGTGNDGLREILDYLGSFKIDFK